MRSFVWMTLLICACAAAPHAAGFVGPGAMMPVYRAADVLSAVDDSPCVVEGRIVSKIQGRKNRYLFEDASGQVVVEIKKKVFGAHTVTPDNIVRIEGEVEVDEKYANEIEAESLAIVK